MILKKLFKLIFTLCLALFAVFIIINIFMVIYSGRYIITADEAKETDAQCALVLGAHVYSSGSLSPMLFDRVYTGVSLYNNGAVPKLIMSGDHGKSNYDEVNAMKTTAVDLNVDPADVFMDHAGFSTYESAYRAKQIFSADRVIFVTQKYHLYRTIFIARMFGIEAYGVSADLREYRNDLYNNLRESVARCKDLLFVLFRPDPTYLGDKIDLTGSGQQTDDLPIYNYTE